MCEGKELCNRIFDFKLASVPRFPACEREVAYASRPSRSLTSAFTPPAWTGPSLVESGNAKYEWHAINTQHSKARAVMAGGESKGEGAV